MSESAKDPHAATGAASACAIVHIKEALMPSAAHDASRGLLSARGADRLADLLSSPRVEAEANARDGQANARDGVRRIEIQLDRADALLRDAIKYYERHVLAWYALGRLTQARSAREAIVNHRRALVAEPTHSDLTR
jgi:hypothetical protein